MKDNKQSINNQNISESDTAAEVKKVEILFLRVLDEFKKLYSRMILNFDEYDFFNKKPLHLDDLTSMIKSFSYQLLDFLNTSSLHRYILLKSNGYTLQNKIDDLCSHFVFRERDLNNYEVINIDATILNHAKQIHTFLEWYSNYFDIINARLESDQIIEDLKEKVKDTSAVLQLMRGARTETIYSTARDNYLKFARYYDISSYFVLLIILGLGGYIFVNFPQESNRILNFFLSKILIITTLVTLATIFLRKAAHLRKLYDQANQTSMELQALPLYLLNVDESEHSEIYKKLAEKYFGKEIDQKQNDKIGDLMQDQLSAGTELIKASAELVKSVKPSALADNASDRSNN